jgi:hypothetical protein
MAGEDVEDELGAIDNRARKSGLNITSLRRRQIVIEEDKTSACRCDRGDDFIELAAAYKGCRIGPASTLDQYRRYGCARRPGELLELRQRRIEVQIYRRLWCSGSFLQFVERICGGGISF